MKNNLKEEVSIISNYSEWFEKGIAFFNNADFTNSIFNFSKCLKLKSNDPEVWYKIAIAYRKMGRALYAEACMEQVLKLNPNNEDMIKLQEEIHSESFNQTMLLQFNVQPIKGIKIEEKGIKERSEAILDYFRPYLMAYDSAIEILGIETQNKEAEVRNEIKLETTGALGGMYMGMTKSMVEGDIQRSLQNLDPSISLKWIVNIRI